MSLARQGKRGGKPLRPGDRVVIASRAEILATLDADGTLDGMPVMPQMLDLCGTQQTVYKRADKTCDTVSNSGGRRLHNTVHLAGLRCDGGAYGDCQAGCLIFWNERWLKPESGDSAAPDEPDAEREAAVARGTRQPESNDGTIRYRCQATELLNATEPLAGTDIRQYWRDWRTNDVGLVSLLRVFFFWLFRNSLKLGAYDLQIRLFNRWQRLWGRDAWPFRVGSLEKTPELVLDLQPGELARVKSHDQILATLDTRNRNRGLHFDEEMVKFCGRVLRVQQRVTKILNEKTGEMMIFGSPGIILENAFCTADISSMRLFCPRSIHHYWREIWLERVDESGAGQQPADQRSSRSSVQ